MKRYIGLIVALLFASLTFSQTRTEIKPAELSKTISSYIAKNFSGYNVDKVFKIDSKGIMSTQVMVSNRSEKLVLTFDKEFRLTKKAIIKPESKTVQTKEDKKPLPPVREKK